MNPMSALSTVASRDFGLFGCSLRHSRSGARVGVRNAIRDCVDISKPTVPVAKVICRHCHSRACGYYRESKPLFLIEIQSLSTLWPPNFSMPARA